MIDQLAQKSALRPAAGFSLVEVLVAMAVLALLLVLMLQVVESIMRSTRVQNQQMDSLASARRALDLLESDLRTAVISGDSSVLAAVSTTPQIAFLSRRRGPENATNHRFLSLAYASDTEGQIIRSYQSVPYSETNLLQILPVDPDAAEPLAKGILQWQIRAVTETGRQPTLSTPGGSWATNEYNGLPVPPGYQAMLAAGPGFASGFPDRTRALEVWVAAVDSQHFSLLTETGSLGALQNSLITNDPERWRAIIDGADIPSQVRSSARVLKKTISLP